MTRRLVFWVLFTGVVAAHLVIAGNSLFVMHLWEDEAYNLSVPLNLVRGLGYVSDGTLMGSQLTPFDVRISTGPTVLLPIAGMYALGADMVIGARLVTLAYWILLLTGLWILGRRIGGRWAALAAIAVPLALNTLDTNSPLQGPADVLGEIPTAALLIWALIAVEKRPWLAGIVLGLAVQTKFIALESLPAFAIALMILAGAAFWRSWRFWRDAGLALAGVIAPTVVYELCARLALGGKAYGERLEIWWWFLTTNGIEGLETARKTRIRFFLESWFLPLWAAALVMLVVGVLVALLVGRKSSRAELRAPRPAWLVAALIGAGTYSVWWILSSHTPLWIRQAAPGLLAFVPLLFAFAVLSVRILWARHAERLPRVSLSVAATALTVALGASLLAHLGALGTREQDTLAEQRADAAALGDHSGSWLGAWPWSEAVSIAVLTGAHAGVWDHPSMKGTPRITENPCTAPLAEGARWRICPPAP